MFCILLVYSFSLSLHFYSEVKSLSSCPTLCDPMDCSLPGSSVHGIFQARVLEPFPSPGDLPDPGIKPRSPALQADALPSEIPIGDFKSLFFKDFVLIYS